MADPGRTRLHHVQSERLASHLTRASAVSMAVRVVGLALAFLSHLALSRLLGAQQYGQVMIALGWAMVLVIPARMGMDNSVLRFATLYREEGRSADFRGLVTYSLGVMLAVSVLIGAAIFLGKAASAGPLAPISWAIISGIALLVPALAILGWLSALVRTANHIFASQFYEQVLRPVLLIGGLAMLVALGGTIDSGRAMLLTAITVIIATAGLALHARTIFAGLPGSEASFARRKQWQSVSWPLLLMAAVQELLNQVDLILLGVLANATEAAHFAAAMRLASLASFGLMAIGTVSGPLIASAFHRHDMAELDRIAKMTARFSTVFAAVTAAMLILVGRPALGLFGPGFDAAYLPLLVLLAGGLANSVTGVAAYLLIMTGSEKAAVHVLAGALAVSIGANLLLIPEFGTLGAAIASAVAMISWNAAMVVLVRRRLGIDATVLGHAVRNSTAESI